MINKNTLLNAPETNKRLFEKEQFSRRTGRTTRLADNCIQDLFKKGFCICVDHYIENELASDLLFNIVVGRLNREHSISINKFIINKQYRIIAINEKLFQEGKHLIRTGKI